MTRKRTTKGSKISNGSDRAVLYLRISYDPEGKAAGVARQRSECMRLAEEQGLTVVNEYVDNDRSAYSRRPRPAFERLLTDMGSDLFDHVIVWASDRLYRRLADLTRITDALQDTGVQVEQVHGGRVDLTTAEGILRAQVMGSVAEYESRHKGDRLRSRASQRARQEGRMITTKLTTGWRWIDPCPGGDDCEHGKTCDRPGLRPVPRSRAGIEPDPVEGPLVVKAYQMVADGGSLNACARMFNDSGILAKYTDRWKPSTMRTALLNERNAGLVAHNGEVVGEAANGFRLVSVDLYQQVRTILTDPARKTAGRPAGTIFSAIARCGRCDGPMNASNKDKSPVYICARNQHLTRRRHLVDKPALEQVRGWIVEHAGVLADYVEPEAGPTQRVAAEEVARLNDRLAALSELAASGSLDPEDYARTARTIRERLVDAKQRATIAAGRPAVSKLLQAADPGAEFDRMATDTDVEPLRAVLKDLLEGVTVVPGATGLAGLDIRWQKWVTEAVDGTAA